MKRVYIIYLLTLIVAFCSIVYELIFSQALTIIFGGTVLRYSVTIGLFLFSLGIGSFLYRYFDSKNKKINFFRIEILLSLIGPLGLLFIISINSITSPLVFTDFFQTILLLLSHVPIILVGILSGLEIPFLSSMAHKNNNFSEVLGFDYLGSLVGTLIYALYLYPGGGLISSILVIGFLNLIVAVVFYWTLYQGRSRLLYYFSLLFILIYIILLINNVAVTEAVQRVYLETDIRALYWSFGAQVINVKIIENFRTPYQEVTKYNLKYLYPENNPDDVCLNLDRHVQICDSWAESYHFGLIDVPSLLISKEDLEVLLIGGGDWIAINNLKKYNAKIDHVDIDKKFTEYTKTDDYFIKYHENSYEYEKLNTIFEDGFYFIKNNNKKYDLIVLDLPGIEDDKLLHLFSVEFYKFLNDGLKDDGFLVSWTYSKDKQPKHNKVLMNTIKEAGFENYLLYYSYTNYHGEKRQNEAYYIYPKEFTPNFNFDKLPEEYKDLKWEKINYNKGVKTNSIFSPNYDIIIKRKKVYRGTNG